MIQNLTGQSIMTMEEKQKIHEENESLKSELEKLKVDHDLLKKEKPESGKYRRLGTTIQRNQTIEFRSSRAERKLSFSSVSFSIRILDEN